MTSRTVSSAVALSISLMFLIIFAFAGINKIGPVPDWFNQSFGGTFLASFPGLSLSYYSIVAIELLIFVLLVVSILRREFLSGNFKPYLVSALLVSLFLFVQLTFGQLLIQGDVPKIFIYFSGTLVALLSIRYFEKESF